MREGMKRNGHGANVRGSIKTKSEKNNGHRTQDNKFEKRMRGSKKAVVKWGRAHSVQESVYKI